MRFVYLLTTPSRFCHVFSRTVRVQAGVVPLDSQY